MKAKSSLKTALLLILCLCSTLFVELSAVNPTLVKKETSNVSFITPEIKTTSGESVEVCLANNLQPSFDLKMIDLSLSRYINDTHSTLSNYQVTFLPGIRETCFELHIPSAVTTANYILEIQGEQETLSISTSPQETNQVAWCGAAPLTNPDVTEQTVATDNFGNYYTFDLISIPRPNALAGGTVNNGVNSNCGCDQFGINLTLFDLYFEDCIFNSDTGFDDPNLGPDRREALCASLLYLEQLIVPNQSICNPGESRRVNIQVLPSDNVANYPVNLQPIPSNVLGFASPFYSLQSFYEGIRHSWPWEIINSGEYPSPIDEDFYHAITKVQFFKL